MRQFLKSIFRQREPMSSAPPQSVQTSATDAAEEAKSLGNQHLAKGDLDRAAACYREALRLNPAFAEACNNLGYVLKEQQRYAEAAAMLDMALANKPDLGPAHLNRGLVALATGKRDGAEKFFRQAAAYMPENAECRCRLGDMLYAQEQFGQAIQAYESALGIDPNLPGTRVNLGSACYKLGQHVEAERHYRIALEEFHRADAAYFLGILHHAAMRWDESCISYRKAIEIQPGYVQAHWNLAVISLLRGDYSRETWEHFEARLGICEADDGTILLDDVKRYLPRFGPDRYWDGRDLAGQRLLVWMEQGLGDSLMMMRYLPYLKERGAEEVLVYADPPLVRIMDNVANVDQVIPKTQPLAMDAFDVHVSTFSLAARFSAHPDNLTALPSPYLKIPDGAVRHWAPRFATLPGLKIGLVWSGRFDLPHLALRCVTLAALAPLMDVPGISWISLQKGEAAEQLKNFDRPVADWIAECQDMLDTAALVANLDLVISVDTAVAHLAGALGRPVWLLNRYDGDWRWMPGREYSLWYPTIRIFNQPSPGDWESVIAQVQTALALRLGR